MKKLKIPRSLVLLIVFFIMFSILIVRLFQLQIVKGQEYENNFILQTKEKLYYLEQEEIFMIVMANHLLQIS